MIPSRSLVALALGLGAAVFVAVTRQASPGAAIAGAAVTAASILLLGPETLLPLAVFVLGGGLLTRWGRAQKTALGVAEPNQGTRRASHVAAKLGLPALLAVAGWGTGAMREWSVAYASALAGALADTAATEVGPLFRGPAAGLRAGRFVRLPHGSRGAVSAAGLAAAAAGGAAVALGARAVGLIQGHTWIYVLAAGFLAALIESLVADTAWGRAFGHFGRNVLVSGVASALGLWVGFSGWGLR